MDSGESFAAPTPAPTNTPTVDSSGLPAGETFTLESWVSKSSFELNGSPKACFISFEENDTKYQHAVLFLTCFPNFPFLRQA